jgi:hypothetical protein
MDARPETVDTSDIAERVEVHAPMEYTLGNSGPEKTPFRRSSAAKGRGRAGQPGDSWRVLRGNLLPSVLSAKLGVCHGKCARASPGRPI